MQSHQPTDVSTHPCTNPTFEPRQLHIRHLLKEDMRSWELSQCHLLTDCLVPYVHLVRTIHSVNQYTALQSTQLDQSTRQEPNLRAHPFRSKVLHCNHKWIQSAAVGLKNRSRCLVVGWFRPRVVSCNSPETFRSRVSCFQLTTSGLNQSHPCWVVYFYYTMPFYYNIL